MVGRRLLILGLVATLILTACSREKSVEAYLEDGREHLENDDLSKAIAALEEALKRDPERAETHRLLGEALARSERWPEAVKEFEAYQALASDDPAAYFWLGQAYVHTDQLEKAAAAFAQGVRLDPSFLTDHEAEVEAVAEDILRAGREALDAGDLETATELLDVVAPLLADQGEVYLSLGQAHLEAGDIPQALAAFANAIDLNPELATEYAQEIEALAEQGLELSQAALQERDLERAARIAEALTTLMPDAPRPHFLLGNVYNEANQLERAIQAYETVLDLNPESASAHTNLGVVYYKMGQLERAIQQYQTALELEPDDAETHYLLGAAYLQMEVPDAERVTLLQKAQAEFEAALAANDQLAPAYIGLGNVYLLQGDVQPALTALEKATSLAPNSPEAYFALAQVYVQLGDDEQARDALERMLSLNPAPIWRDRAQQLLESLDAP